VFERHHQPLLHKRGYIRRIIRFSLLGLLIVFGSLGLGVFGYHYTEAMPWLDAFLNASMILFGMGPVNPVQTDGGKWFASFYAMYSGVAFITIIGVIFAPVFHRFLHKFHLDLDNRDDKKNNPD
jgi:hypothetical protein